MKIFLLCSIVLSSLVVQSQIDELRKAQDVRKNYVNAQGKSPFAFDKLQYVNPFVGTGGHGHTYPGASAPFGMIQLSPDSRHDGWDGCSGYHYSDSIIYGFSHTHLSGTGVSDYGDLLIVPQNGKAKIDPGYSVENGYGSHFSHENEKASPGYYSVKLDEENIDVRLTVSERAGFHEYTFNNEKGNKYILIDLDHRDQLLSSTLNIIDKQTITGSRTSSAWASKQHFFFHLELDTPYKKAKKIISDGKNKLLLTFSKSTKKINIKVGISAVGCDGARMNLRKEIPNWNFEATKKRTEARWRKELDKIGFYTENREVMFNFYTALYHAYLNPNLFTDVDGRYRGRDHEVHQIDKDEYPQYTVFSLWDTYRATHPLFTLTQVKRTNAFVNTFLRQYEQGGDLPVWELAGNETECMIGYHSVSVIADAYTKGIYDYDAYRALEAMIATSNFDEFGKREFVENGFISTSDEPESVSKTLEYSYDDFCIEQMLSRFTQDNDDPVFAARIDEYHHRSLQFVNIYDPKSKFMRARRSGQWFSPFNPAEVNFNYTEANSWQYSLYAPHAVGVLSKLLGGKDSLEHWMDRLFSTRMELSGRHQVDITGLIGQYAHGNEPSHHMAYLYNYTNSPHKTQFYIDSILYEMYSNTPDGLSGNEDCGQMSSWYVLSAMGIYQIAPGRPNYEFGRPLLDEAILQFESGKKLRVKAHKNKKANKFIQKVVLNGRELKRHYITHDELTQGGKLEFFMGSEPNLSHVSFETAPSINEMNFGFIPIPYFEEEDRIFEDQMDVHLNMFDTESYSIYYTLDNTDPETSNTRILYSDPINIKNTTTIRAVAAKENTHGYSKSISNEFVLKDKNLSIELHSEYGNQYAAYGDYTLIDGIQGNNEYRSGEWQGYWAQDLIAEVSFKEEKSFSSIGLGCLSDMKSWIFYPSELIVEGSTNGKDFVEIGRIEIEALAESQMFPQKKNFTIEDQGNMKYSKVRITARNHGPCPEWHLGAGNDTWLFVDEIIFK